MGSQGDTIVQMGVNELYARYRHRDFAKGAEHDRLLLQVERTEPIRRPRLIRNMGTLLVSVGSWLSGDLGNRPDPEMGRPAVLRAAR
ncbi:MAG: hypothetical protein IT337_03650 [Thermomicrobiales bacterium]|nr:hypothetical protein [Thermomicrobiales bacterium]